MNLAFRFLGVGSASQIDLGHATAVVELASANLLIDCGPGTVKAFLERYEELPDAVFVTHCHLDHVGDFENLFIRAWFSQKNKKQIKLFVPNKIVPLLHQRVASYPQVLAEGGVNFWDAFQLIPVGEQFVYQSLIFSVVEVRHHSPGSAYGLYLEDAFFYTGDTRPIPEVFKFKIDEKAILFHDCGLIGNPSHTGIDDLAREYPPELIQRLNCYHYASSEDQQIFQNKGLAFVKPGDSFEINIPDKQGE